MRNLLSAVIYRELLPPFKHLCKPHKNVSFIETIWVFNIFYLIKDSGLIKVP